MNWFKENKFLAVFLAVILTVCGGVAFLLLNAKSRAEAAAQNYDTQSAELIRLEGMVPYPNAVSLKKLDEQKKTLVTKLQGLTQEAAAMQISLKETTPEQFQDELRESVTAYTKLALEAGMKLPEKFYMGFDQYEHNSPKAALASILERDHKAIELVLGFLPANKTTELESISRAVIPEEGGDAAPAPKPGSSKPPGQKASDKSILQKHSFVIVFRGPQMSLQGVLNAISSNTTQFFIPRIEKIENEQDKGPSRAAANAAAQLPPQAAPDSVAAPEIPGSGLPPSRRNTSAAPSAAPAPPIVGEELIRTTLYIDIVDVAAPVEKKSSAK